MPVTIPNQGTRGSAFPRRLVAFFSPLQRRAFRRGHGARTQGGVPTLLLETVGARSGRPRTAALGYLEEGPGAWLIVASLAGSKRHPAWLYNLGHDPIATIEFADGRRVRVEASTLDGPDLDRAWQRFAVDAPEYVKYNSKTDRSIPILRLTEIGAPA